MTEGAFRHETPRRVTLLRRKGQGISARMEVPKEFVAIMEMAKKFMEAEEAKLNRIKFEAQLTEYEVLEVSKLLKRMRQTGSD